MLWRRIRTDGSVHRDADYDTQNAQPFADNDAMLMQYVPEKINRNENQELVSECRINYASDEKAESQKLIKY